MLSRIKANKNEFVNEFLFFRIGMDISDLVTWSYYIILILRTSGNDVSIVFLNQGILYMGLLLGFLIAGLFIDKIGFLKIYRFANFGLFLVTIITLITLPHILEVHLAMAALRGFGKGLFWATNNVYIQKEVHGASRSRLLSLITSISQLLQVILPVLLGAYIVDRGYEGIFVMGSVIYLAAALYPWQYNKIPRSKFTFAEIKRFSRKRGFKRLTGLMFLNEFMGNQQAMAMAAIPFLFIGDEFGVGVLSSILALIGALVAYKSKDDKESRKLKLGYASGWIIDIANIVFTIIWTLPMMVIRGVILQFASALYLPPKMDIEYRNRESLLGDFTQESAVEVMVYTEVILFLARMANLVIAIVLFFVLEVDQMNVLKAIFAFTAIREVITLFLHKKLSGVLRR